MTNPRKVVFLCAGNTCRSPLAEALARRQFGARGVEFASAGLEAAAGEPASEGSQLVAAELGIDLAGHRSRPVTAALLADAQWVVTMTRGQAAQLRRRFPGYSGRVGLLGLPGVDLSDGMEAAGAEEVADPHGGSPDAYRRMADQVERLLGTWRAAFASPAGEEP